MKKTIFFALVLCLLLIPLCGCSSGFAGTGESHKYLVSAIGFDYKDKIEITVEAVAVNSEDAAGKKRILINGSGKTPAEALSSAEQKATQPFDLSHCGAIVLGLSLTADNFAGICDYCYDTDELTFSVYMVSAENAGELLKPEPVSSVAVGYDIMSMLEKKAKNSDTDFKNSLYEVASARERKSSTVKLPFIEVSGDYREITGLAVYKNNSLDTFENF